MRRCVVSKAPRSFAAADMMRYPSGGSPELVRPRHVNRLECLAAHQHVSPPLSARP